MRLSRREWLVRATGVAAGAALIYGLPALSAVVGKEREEPKAPKRPPWLDEALAEMRRTKSPGVAILVPSDDGTPAATKRRSALQESMARLLETRSYETQELLVEAVWVCVDAAHVGGRSGETAVLLDAPAERLLNRVAGTAIGVETEKEFVLAAKDLLRGGKRFDERAKAVRTEAIAKEIARIQGTDEEWPVAQSRLLEVFPFARAAVIQARLDAKGEEHRERLSTVVRTYWDRRTLAAGTGSVGNLPFGAKWEREPLPADAPDPCPACGMGRVPEPGRVLFEFLTEAKQAK